MKRIGNFVGLNTKKMKLFLILLLSITGSVRGVAQEVTFTASAPKVVEVGEQFSLVFSLNQRGEDLKVTFPEEFTWLAGPYPAMQSESYVDSNGKVSSSTINTYTYVLTADKEGTLTIEPGTILVGNKRLSSNKLTVKVVKGSTNTRHPTRDREDPQPTSSTVTSEDLFLRCELSRSSLYLGESVVATVKLYTRVNLTGFRRYKPPSFAGFLTERNPVGQGQIQFERAEYNGRVYEASIIDQAKHPLYSVSVC